MVDCFLLKTIFISLLPVAAVHFSWFANKCLQWESPRPSHLHVAEWFITHSSAIFIIGLYVNNYTMNSPNFISLLVLQVVLSVPFFLFKAQYLWVVCYRFSSTSLNLCTWKFMLDKYRMYFCTCWCKMQCGILCHPKSTQIPTGWNGQHKNTYRDFDHKSRLCTGTVLQVRLRMSHKNTSTDMDAYLETVSVLPEVGSGHGALSLNQGNILMES